jgi:hypothetical protein
MLITDKNELSQHYHGNAPTSHGRHHHGGLQQPPLPSLPLLPGSGSKSGSRKPSSNRFPQQQIGGIGSSHMENKVRKKLGFCEGRPEI